MLFNNLWTTPERTTETLLQLFYEEKQHKGITYSKVPWAQT